MEASGEGGAWMRGGGVCTLSARLCLCNSLHRLSSLLRARMALLCSFLRLSLSWISWFCFFCSVRICFWVSRCSSSCRKGKGLSDWHRPFVALRESGVRFIHEDARSCSPVRRTSYTAQPVFPLECSKCSASAWEQWFLCLRKDKRQRERGHRRQRNKVGSL